ncbi:MAG: hypothetical protein ACR2NF_00755, partial [Pirellulales bacterium]
MSHQSITVSEAARQLLNDEYAGWSHEGAHALAQHLAETRGKRGTPELGFNVIDIWCEHDELTAAGLVREYGYLLNLPSDPAWAVGCDGVIDKLIEVISDSGTSCLIKLDNGGFIVGQF